MYKRQDWVATRLASDLVRRGGPLTRWLISSFRAETVETCRRLVPDVRTAWLVMQADAGVLERSTAAGHAAVHPWVDALTEPSVRAAHAVGLAVNTWTCDEPARMRELLAWGVDGICTNVPDAAVRARGERSA